MQITRDMLLYYLRDMHPQVIHRKSKKWGFAGLRHPDESEAAPDPGFLYVCRAEEAIELQGLLTDEICMLVLIGTGGEEPAWEDAGILYRLDALPCELILIRSAASFRSLMNRLSRIFHSLTDWDKDMHIAVLEGKDVQGVLDVCEKMLEYPVILFDCGLDVLAYTKNKETTDRLHDGIVERGYIDAETVYKLKEHNIFTGNREDEILAGPSMDDMAGENIYLQFFDQQTLLGYACVHTPQNIAESGYRDVLRVFLHNMTFCMRRDYEDKLLRGRMYETALIHFIENRDIAPDRMQEWLQRADGLPEQGRYIMAVIEFEQPEMVPLAFLARMIERQCVHIKVFLYKSRICLFKAGVLDMTGMTLLADAEWRRLKELLGKYRCAVGISNTVFSARQIYDACRQAEKAACFGRAADGSGVKLCYYRDVWQYHLLDTLRAEIAPESIQNEIYTELKLYDAKHRTNYCRTVLTYIRANGSATLTAQQLSIHRNTVRNIVQFAEEQYGFCADDPAVRAGFLLSGSIEEYQAIFGENK